jgi:formylmethanofuran dehydrogenase subunit E
VYAGEESESREIEDLWSSDVETKYCAAATNSELNSKITRSQNRPIARFLMKSLDEYLADAEQAHGHLCAGQVLGVRLAMLGLFKLGIEDPRGKDRKRLVTFVEIDRCATDAVAVVTGCRLGKRALKFRDWGKVAATFVDVSHGKAIRIAAKESSKALARQMHPEIADKNQQQMRAYREITDDDLFTTQWVKVVLPPEEFPGYKGERIVCDLCAEGINFKREVIREGKVLCRACAGEQYYEVL